MSRLRTSLGTAAVGALALAVAPVLAQGAAEGPGLGRPATPEEIAHVDISIPPSGENLPPGSGTVAAGAMVFAERCVACHGEAGAGGQGLTRLTGGVGSLATDMPVKTVNSYWPYATTVFDYIRRAMPLDAPQSLTNEQVYAVTAYILSIDGVVPEDATLDATTLPQVEMPNRNGFVNWYMHEGDGTP